MDLNAALIFFPKYLKNCSELDPGCALGFGLGFGRTKHC
jgi:hypothetical protein